MKNLETLLKDYADHVAERATKGIPPLPLNAEQTNCITKLLEQDSTYDSSYLPVSYTHLTLPTILLV